MITQEEVWHEDYREWEKDRWDKDKEYIKTLTCCVHYICLGLAIKIFFSMIGSDCFNIDKNFYVDSGNEVFIDLGNEIFTVICILSVVFTSAKIAFHAKDEFCKIISTNSIDIVDRIWKQSNCFFVVSITACVIGFILIVISVILISIKGGGVINFLLVLAGIISEITAAGFLVVYNRSIEQMNLPYKLAIKRKQYSLLKTAVEKLEENKEEVLLKIIENILKDYEEEAEWFNSKEL